LDKLAAPLYYASYLGFTWITEKLLPPKSNEIKADENRVNVQGGRYRNALQAASVRGHAVVVKMLLNKGSEVNAQGGYFGNALYAASEGCHKAVVKLLLDKGADVNAQGADFLTSKSSQAESSA
jgi:ankyrin repeat protein